MRTSILIVGGVVVLCLGWFAWTSFNRHSASNSWDVVSSKALVVIETDNFGSLQDKLKQNIGASSMAFIDKSITTLAPAFFNKRELLLAFYANNKSIDCLFIIPRQGKSAIQDLVQKEVQIKGRNFNGYDINDLYQNKSHLVSSVVVDDLLIIGPSFLVEDALRVYGNSEMLFKERNSPLFQLKTLKTDDGNIYVNIPALLYGNERKGNQALISRLAPSALVDLKIDEDQIFMNGFTADSLDASTLFSQFKNQRPGAFLMKEIISVQSSFITHYALSDPAQWISKRDVFLNQYFPAIKSQIEKTKKEQSIDIHALQNSIGSELAVCHMESPDGSYSQIVVAKTKDNSIENSLMKLQNTQEQYSTYVIRELNDSTLVKCMLWPVVTKDEFVFFSKLNEYALFSSDREALKGFLSDYDSENTLSKSLEWNKFLSTSMQESSINLFFTGSGLNHVVKDNGLSFLESFAFSGIDKAAVQFSALDEHFYTNAIILLKESGKAKEKNTTASPALKFNGVITRLPSVVLNHADRTSEVFLQDSLNTIYLTSPQNKLLWSLNLGEEIRGEIKQIDFYKNRKLQYFFTTKNNLQLIDRLGRNVTGFPKQVKLNQDEILFSKVVDYDNTRNYRFMVVTKKGNIYLYDQNGNGLEGWNPKFIGAAVLDGDHYRIGGKDYFVFLQGNGLLHLFQRSGEMVTNFPVKLTGKPTSLYFVQGKSQSSSYFSVVDEGGILMKIDVTGKITAKEPLLKNYAQNNFKIISSGRNDQYLIARTDKTKIAFFDGDGKLVFEKENPASEQVEFRFFPGRNPVISVFDPSQDLLFLLDGKGKDIIAQPIEASQSPAIEFLSNDKIKVYYVLANQLHSVILPL